MTVNEKIKTIDNKVDQIKTQHNLDLQKSKISALPSGNVNQY